MYVSLKLTEYKIRNDYNVKSVKAARLVVEIGKPVIISQIVLAVIVIIAILTVRSLTRSPMDSVETLSQSRKTAACMP